MQVRLFIVIALIAAVVAVATPNGARRAQQRIGSPAVAFGFVGSGFHQQFRISAKLPRTAASSENVLHIMINLPRAFFFDIAEVLQMHTWENATSLALSPSIDSMSSEYVFDIEAPIFRVPYSHNMVDIRIKLGSSPRPSSVSSANPTLSELQEMQTLSVLLPVHTRYEEVDAERPFLWSEFTATLDSYKRRCVETDDVHAEIILGGSNPPAMVLLSTEASKTSCVMFPQGILSHLPVVYWLTMGLLTMGALFVILLIR